MIHKYLQKILLEIFLFVSLLPVFSVNTNKTIHGEIIDALTKEPLPTVQIYNQTCKQGTISDGTGQFSIPYLTNNDTIVFQYIGYKQQIFCVNTLLTQGISVSIKLYPETYQIDNVVVRAKKNTTRYKRKGNPAIELIKKVIDRKDINRFGEWNSYQTSVYNKIVVSLCAENFNPKKDWLFKEMPFLAQHIDTVCFADFFAFNDSTNLKSQKTNQKYATNNQIKTLLNARHLNIKQPIINFFMCETNGKKFYDKKDNHAVTVVDAIRKDGIDKLIDFGNLDSYTQMIFRPIDICDNQIKFINTELVSPLSSTLATSFYKYYIIDTLIIEGQSCIDLAFMPANTQSFGFTGHLYILNDSTYTIKRFTMHLPRNINMNWVRDLWVKEEFEQLPNKTWLPKRTDIGVSFSITNQAKRSFFGHQTLYYDKYTFDSIQTTFNHSINNYSYISKEAKQKGDSQFDTLRPIQLNEKEVQLKSLHSKITSKKKIKNIMQTIKTIVREYATTSRLDDSSKFDVGPIFNTISYNNQEGVRLRLGGMTTANVNPRWFTYFYVAYGFHDKRIKGQVDIIHSFTKKDYHPYEPLRNNLTLTLKYDLSNLSESHSILERDAVFRLIGFQDQATPMQYIALIRLKYEKQWNRGIDFCTHFDFMNNQPNGANGTRKYLQVPYFDRSPLKLKYLFKNDDNTLRERPFYHEVAWTTQLRFRFSNFAFNSIRGAESPFAIWRQAPIITLTNELSWIKEDRFLTNRIKLEIENRFMLSLFGYLDAHVSFGYVCGKKVPFTKLFSSPTNHSYVIDRRSFTLMSEMEFAFDRYAEWHLTYHLNGLIINRIPLLKKSKLRGVVSFHGVIGYLSDRNNPNKTSGLYELPFVHYLKKSDTPIQAKTNFKNTNNRLMPYMEMSVGIENIFKILRIDYVRRLSHNENLTGWEKNSIRFYFSINL